MASSLRRTRCFGARLENTLIIEQSSSGFVFGPCGYISVTRKFPALSADLRLPVSAFGERRTRHPHRRPPDFAGGSSMEAWLRRLPFCRRLWHCPNRSESFLPPASWLRALPFFRSPSIPRLERQSFP